MPRERQILDERLPVLGKGGVAPRVFVAPERFGNGPPHGLGVFQPPGDSSTDAGSGKVYLFVGPDRRRQGIGSALLHRVIEAATVMGLKTLETLKPINPEDTARPFLLRNGFESVAVVIDFEADLAVLLAFVASLHRRLAQRGKIPSNAELVPIEASPVSEVRKLVVGHLPRLAVDLEPDLSSFTGTASRALLVNGELFGVTLEKTVGDVPYLYAIAVAPGRRNTWVCPYLEHALYSTLVAEGEARIRFRASESINKGVLKTAKRAKAEVLASMEHFHLVLADKAESTRPTAENPRSA